MIRKKGLVFLLFLTFLFVAIFGAFKLGFFYFDKKGITVPVMTKITVGNETISYADISTQRQLTSGFWAHSKFATDSATLETAAENTLINQKIIAQEAKRLGISVSQDEMTTEINNRIKPFGAEDVFVKILASYHWTMGDLKTEVYNQLLEQKVRFAKEPHMYIQAVIFTPTNLQKSLALSLANQSVKDFKANKDFESIKISILKETVKSNLIVQFFNRQIQGKEIDQVTQNKAILKFYKSLKTGEAAVYTAPLDFIISAYEKDAQPGIDFELWLAQERGSLVKRESIFPKLSFRLVNSVCANWDPTGKTCGGISRCADPNFPDICGNNNMDVCDYNLTSLCSTPGFSLCCIQDSPIGGWVKDASTGRGIPGATVNGQNTKICRDNNMNNWTGTSDPFGQFWLGWFNCYGGTVTITASAPGYNTASISQPIDNISAYNPTIWLSNNSVPPAKYYCSGSSCIRNDISGIYVGGCGGACTTTPPPPTCDSINSYFSPNPVNPSSGLQMDFTSNNGLVSVALNPGGGTSCAIDCGTSCNCSNNPHGDGKSCWWRYNCTSSGSPGTYTAAFSGILGGTTCNGGGSYTVNPACSTTTCGGACTGACGQQTCLNQCGSAYINGSCGCVSCSPGAPQLVYPADTAKGLPLTVALQWTEPSTWGYACAGAGNSYTIYWKKTTDVSWNSHTNSGNPPAQTWTISGLPYLTTYQWYVVASNGAQTASSPTWTFTTMAQAWWQVVGGNVSAGGGVTSNVPAYCISPACTPYIIKQSP